MTSLRHIGMLTPAWPGQQKSNGIATSVYHLAQGFSKAGVTPVIFTSQIDGHCADDIPVVQIPHLGLRWRDRLRARFGDVTLEGNRLVARDLAAAISKTSREYPLDALLMEETQGWASMLRDYVSVPVFVVLHGPWVLHKELQSKGSTEEDLKREARENQGFMSAAGWIAPSQSVLDAVEAALPLADKPRIVLPNTLLVDPATPLAVQQATDDILFVGRFDLHKGGDTVLDAFVQLTETHPQARLTFAGVDNGVQQPDGARLHLETVLPDLPKEVRQQLTYKGRIDRADVIRLRAQHPIALIASRYEVFGYTVLEAMAAGQAVVSTNVGGPAEILEHEHTALLVPPDNPAEMATALARLIDSPELRVGLGTSARARIKTDFKPAVIAQQTISFIEKALAG